MGLFDDIDRAGGAKPLTNYSTSATRPVRAPFPWPGGKGKSVTNILELLPNSSVYCEPFGGSFAVGLCKPKTELDAYNDIHNGVTSFYECMRDPEKFDLLTAMVNCTIHSEDAWFSCRETWQREPDDVLRAFKWYYATAYSFGGLGRNFARAKTAVKGTLSGKIRNNLRLFPELHERMKQVQVTNMDYHKCLEYYDGPDTVFYMDPPYLNVTKGVYKSELTVDQHKELLNHIFSLQGFVALSGYDNELYNSYDWSDKYDWRVRVHIEGPTQRKAHATECLWIKEFS